SKSRESTGPTTPPLPPTAHAASYAPFTCPWICASPRTIESRLDTTRNRCSTLRRSRWMYRCRLASASGRFARAARSATAWRSPSAATSPRYSSVRLHVESRTASRATPRPTTSSRAASASFGPNTKRSRTSMGAVRWLRPTTAIAMTARRHRLGHPLPTTRRRHTPPRAPCVPRRHPRCGAAAAPFALARDWSRATARPCLTRKRGPRPWTAGARHTSARRTRNRSRSPARRAGPAAPRRPAARPAPPRTPPTSAAPRSPPDPAPRTSAGTGPSTPNPARWRGSAPESRSPAPAGPRGPACRATAGSGTRARTASPSTRGIVAGRGGPRQKPPRDPRRRGRRERRAARTTARGTRAPRPPAPAPAPAPPPPTTPPVARAPAPAADPPPKPRHPSPAPRSRSRDWTETARYRPAGAHRTPPRTRRGPRRGTALPPPRPPSTTAGQNHGRGPAPQPGPRRPPCRTPGPIRAAREPSPRSHADTGASRRPYDRPAGGSRLAAQTNLAAASAHFPHEPDRQAPLERRLAQARDLHRRALLLHTHHPQHRHRLLGQPNRVARRRALRPVDFQLVADLQPVRPPQAHERLVEHGGQRLPRPEIDQLTHRAGLHRHPRSRRSLEPRQRDRQVARMHRPELARELDDHHVLRQLPHRRDRRRLDH